MVHIILQNKKITLYLCIFIGILGLILTGCNNTSVDDSLGELTLQFQTTDLSATNAKTSAYVLQQAGDTLIIEGSNGTLVINDIRFIVEDIELELTDSECGALESTEEEGCKEFESNPFFVELPLQGGDVLNLHTVSVEHGLYKELEFEINDLDLEEEEDEEKQQQKQTLINQVRSEFPDWPDSASVVVTGSFTSSKGNGNEIPFKTFAEAEVDIELEFDPPVEIDENTVNKLLKVHIDPAGWFLQTNGKVIDLSQYDFNSTGQVPEFKAEIENGFKSVEVDGEDDNENEEEN